MNVPPLITALFSESDFSTPRTYLEFENWWVGIGNQIAADKPSRHYARISKDKLIKRFWEEALPMLYVLRNAYNDGQTRCRLGTECDESDADLLTLTGDLLKSFQIVFAIVDGRTEYLRMQELNIQGCVPITGTLKEIGKGKNRVVSFTLEAESHTERLDASINRIREEIVKKSNKPYKTTMSLVVYFDDSMTDPDDGKTIGLKLGDIKTPFENIYIVGSTGKKFLSK